MPIGNVCSVAICKNSYVKAKQTGQKLKFFGFPKDPQVCQEWMKKCFRKDKWKADNKRICSQHFTLDDYEDKMQAQLLNLQPKKLKKNAIPSLFLLPEEQKKDCATERTKRAFNKEREAITERLSHAEEKHKPSEEVGQILDYVGVDISEVPSCSKDIEFDILQRKCETLQHENSLLKQKIVQYVETEETLRQQIMKVELIIFGLLAFWMLKKLTRWHLNWTTNLGDCFVYMKITNVLLGLYADDFGLIDCIYVFCIGISLFMSAPRYKIESGVVRSFYVAFPDLNVLKYDILRVIPPKWRF